MPPERLGTALRALAVVALVVVVAAVGRNAEPVAEVQSELPRSVWVIVGAEVLAIVLGCVLLSGPLDQPLFGWLGAALLLSGSGGLALASYRVDVMAVDLVGGVLPGALLLGFALVRQLKAR